MDIQTRCHVCFRTDSETHPGFFSWVQQRVRWWGWADKMPHTLLTGSTSVKVTQRDGFRCPYGTRYRIRESWKGKVSASDALQWVYDPVCGHLPYTYHATSFGMLKDAIWSAEWFPYTENWIQGIMSSYSRCVPSTSSLKVKVGGSWPWLSSDKSLDCVPRIYITVVNDSWTHNLINDFLSTCHSC